MHTMRRPIAANNSDPATALRIAARWCVAAAARLDAEHLSAPPIAPVEGAIVAALADTTRSTLDALVGALTRWCEGACSDAFDHTALAPLALGAVDAAGVCTVAETRDAPVEGDPFAPRR